MGECRLSGACAEEPRPKSLTTRSSPDQRRRPHPSTGCGLLVRKPHLGFLTGIPPRRTRQESIAAGQAPAPAMGECRLSGACAEEPRPKSLTTRSSPDQRRRPHPSTGCGFLVRKPHYVFIDFEALPCRKKH